MSRKFGHHFGEIPIGHQAVVASSSSAARQAADESTWRDTIRTMFESDKPEPTDLVKK